MEWDLKMPPWDLPELEQNAGEANLSSVVGSSGSSTGRQHGGLDCSVDLKLGGLGDFGLADKCKEQRRASTKLMATPPLPAGAVVACSLKRPRATSGGIQSVSCLVDGCRNDLSNCREYHRKHKVCEAHSKTPIVLVGGQEQRFCQQCSRFHLLVEFDEVKRSCRKRLDGHNRRRRKPQPESINSGNLFPNHHVIDMGIDFYITAWVSVRPLLGCVAAMLECSPNPTPMFDSNRIKLYLELDFPNPVLKKNRNRFSSKGTRFTCPQIFPNAATDTTWNSIIKSEEDAFYSHHNPQSMHFIERERVHQSLPHHFCNSFSRGFKDSKQFPFLHGGNDMVLGSRAALEPAAVCQPFLKTVSSAAESSSRKIIFSDGLPPVLDSDCALSLLSSSTQTSGISIGHMVPVDRIPMGQPLPSSLQFSSDGLDRYSRSQAALKNVSPTGFSCSGVENEYLGTVLVSDTGEADLHCQNIFHVGAEGPSDDASHSLHFSWQ